MPNRSIWIAALILMIGGCHWYDIVRTPETPRQPPGDSIKILAVSPNEMDLRRDSTAPNVLAICIPQGALPSVKVTAQVKDIVRIESLKPQHDGEADAVYCNLRAAWYMTTKVTGTGSGSTKVTYDISLSTSDHVKSTEFLARVRIP
ncbi:hypothetical protein KW796_00790 [Candidatus Parcubacteria bacterium]|nr:hypothetical protein [Candidatus Parcubacteria bacterium]